LGSNSLEAFGSKVWASDSSDASKGGLLEDGIWKLLFMKVKALFVEGWLFAGKDADRNKY
jgi:hypothetical protein